MAWNQKVIEHDVKNNEVGFAIHVHVFFMFLFFMLHPHTQLSQTIMLRLLDKSILALYLSIVGHCPVTGIVKLLVLIDPPYRLYL